MDATLPVLVVEDEEMLLSVLTEAVERGGVKALGVTSGTEALGLLERETFSAVVSDLSMPGEIGGVEIFDWVSEHRPQLAQHFVVVTGNVHDSRLQEMRERSGAFILEKPFRITQLTEMVRRMIGPGEAIHA
jgi:DNA-binding NtrC family response regulator